MKNTLETRLGVFFALVMIATIVMIEMVGGFEFFKTGLTLQARFNNVLELKVGDPVKMAGVQIGKVKSIRIAQGKVVVTMKVLEAGAEVRTDSRASIKFSGLMGQNYLAIDLGTPNAPKVMPGGELQTVEQTDLSALMGKLENVASGVENLTKSFSADNMANFLGPINDFVKDNKDKLGDIIGNARTISAQVAQGKGTVGKLIQDDALYHTALTTVTNFNETAQDVRSLLAQAKTTMRGVNEGQGTIGKLINDPKLYNEATATMSNAREVMEKINKGQGSIGQLVNDESIMKSVKGTLQKLDKATDGLEDQGPLTVLGILGGHIF